MSQLESTSDLTGALSQTDLNAQDIQNIIDEFNQFQANLTGGNIQQNQQNIIVFDNTTNRVLIGYNTQLQQWGLFVSKPGVDVTEATPDQLIFNSQQDTFKITSIIDVSVTKAANSTQQVVSTPHGLNYVPVFYSFITGDNTLYFSLPLLTFTTGGLANSIYDVYTDATNVNCRITTPNVSGGTGYPASITENFKIYLLQETAN